MKTKVVPFLCIVAIVMIVLLLWHITSPEEYIPTTEYNTNAAPDDYNPQLELNTNEYTHETDENEYPLELYELYQCPTEYSIETSPHLSPSNLQLALFAHMAFFPFDFNAGDTPRLRGFSPLHYEPFYEWILTSGANGLNAFGFNFAHEMTGWQLLHTYYDDETGFGANLFADENADTLVLAIRGSDGNMAPALLTQSGTWWCNFRSMTGYRHSHMDALSAFLHDPAISKMLYGANLYITGHSLGGFLSYMATYELFRMGQSDQIQRVVVFSTPLFAASTMAHVYALPANLRNRMQHFYVTGDRVSGLIGIEMEGSPHNYSTFELISQLLNTMTNVHAVDIPPTLDTFVNFMISMERIFPVPLPNHMMEIIWLVNGAMSADAMALTAAFRDMISHVTVAHTWHSPQAELIWSEEVSIFETLGNHTLALASDMAIDMFRHIFDMDTHFMMNFYPHLLK